jgi:hypothetical protein
MGITWGLAVPSKLSDTRSMDAEILGGILNQLRGIPCWNVKQGWGSFLTFEFGNPSLDIGQVRSLKPSDPKSPLRRLVTVRGEWHLWIYCCGWRINQDQEVLAEWESKKEEIAAACQALHGQAISDFQFCPSKGTSRFVFDLGGLLQTGPYEEDLREQWMLFCPDGNVLTYRSDGAFAFGPGSGGGERVFHAVDQT